MKLINTSNTHRVIIHSLDDRFAGRLPYKKTFDVTSEAKTMTWILSLHIICMVAWFAGLFYLPRLFVYHADANDAISNERFKIMEGKLYYFIMTPAAILTTIFGLWLLYLMPAVLHFSWMYLKLFLVFLLWVYHLYCGMIVAHFACDKKTHSAKFYRFFNEIPTLLLIAIVILVVVQP